MSDTATYKKQTVRTKTTNNRLLNKKRLVRFNYRLNANGRKTISRMNSDNLRILLTWFGYNFFRSMKMIKETKNEKGKVNRTYKARDILKTAREQFYDLVDLNKYPDVISTLYSKPEKIDIRSEFTSAKWFEELSGYGWNYDFKIGGYVRHELEDVLGQLFDFFNADCFDFDFEEFIKAGKWLTHIKSDSLSGYPENTKQTKAMAAQFASKAVKLFIKWKKGYKIDWWKLSFEMGMRTERNGKHRVVMMAAFLEKILSAIINTLMDLHGKDFPVPLPRSIGHSHDIAAKFWEAKTGVLFAKDFDGFDKSIPKDVFMALFKFFKSINNTFCQLVAFEIDLIMNCYMIVGPQTGYKVNALPSGIGITQFIGSIIHWAIDETVGLDAIFRLYQSDDTAARVKMTIKEGTGIITDIENYFGMKISPIGEKSILHPTHTILLQKVIDCENEITYNHEQRAYTNGLFRERILNVGEKFEIQFGLTRKSEENMNKKNALSYLGNLVSYGASAPSLSNIIAFMYGKRSGFTKTTIDWALTNLQSFMDHKYVVEQHRAMDKTGWLKELFERLLVNEGWVGVTSSTVEAELERLSRATLAGGTS